MEISSRHKMNTHETLFVEINGCFSKEQSWQGNSLKLISEMRQTQEVRSERPRQ